MKRPTFDQAFAIAATLAVVAGLVAGFWVLGTPGQQRLVAADRQRLQDLQQMVYDLVSAAEAAGADYTLPPALEGNDLKRDPLTDQPYEYRRLSDRTYELCADFATDTSTYPLQNRAPAVEDTWQHPAGRHCFEFEVGDRPPPVW